MISQIIGCAECTETSCLMCHNLSPNCLRLWQLPAVEIARLHAHIAPLQIGQAFVHHLIFNQIRSWLSCHSERRENGGHMLYPVLMRSFSQHMAVIFYPVYHGR